MHEVENLVKMANQIADNFSFHEDAAERTADHLKRFWAPSMRQALSAYSEAGGAGLKPGVREALDQLGGD